MLARPLSETCQQLKPVSQLLPALLASKHQKLPARHLATAPRPHSQLGARNSKVWTAHLSVLLQQTSISPLSFAFGDKACKLHCHLYCTLKNDFMTQLTKDIDFDTLKEERLQQLKRSKDTDDMSMILKKEVEERSKAIIAKMSGEELKKLRVIQLEHDFLFHEGFDIPEKSEMRHEHWLEAMSSKSKSQRMKFYLSLQKKHHIKNSLKKKKEERAEIRKKEREAQLAEKDSSDLEQADSSNRLFMRIYDSAMKRWQNHRLVAASKFGLPLVFDMEYADLMPVRDVKNTSKQLFDSYCLHRSDKQMPFHFHFTSCPDTNPIYRRMQLFMNNDPHFLSTVTADSYLDLFPRRDLVYLSPDAKQVMRSYDPKKVYIVGAFNDKSVQKPVSYARSIEHGIACQRLPLDEYLDWQIGSKALTINQLLEIMIALKNGKSWEEALGAVPKRKLRERDISKPRHKREFRRDFDFD